MQSDKLQVHKVWNPTLYTFLNHNLIFSLCGIRLDNHNNYSNDTSEVTCHNCLRVLKALELQKQRELEYAT